MGFACAFGVHAGVGGGGVAAPIAKPEKAIIDFNSRLGSLFSARGGSLTFQSFIIFSIIVVISTIIIILKKSFVINKMRQIYLRRVSVAGDRDVDELTKKQQQQQPDEKNNLLRSAALMLMCHQRVYLPLFVCVPTIAVRTTIEQAGAKIVNFMQLLNERNHIDTLLFVNQLLRIRSVTVEYLSCYFSSTIRRLTAESVKQLTLMVVIVRVPPLS